MSLKIFEPSQLATYLAEQKGIKSPSPSMSTVSCPEYPELQERLHRLAIARDSLSLQVSVLSEQVGAQKEKIRDLEALLALKRNSLSSAEELCQDKQHNGDDVVDLERKNLVFEVSDLKSKFATLGQGMNESENSIVATQVYFDFGNHCLVVIFDEYCFQHESVSANQTKRSVAVPKRTYAKVNKGCEKSHLSASRRSFEEGESTDSAFIIIYIVFIYAFFESRYRSPSSLAARQLAAELDELRQTDWKTQQPKIYSSVSLPRKLGNKASSALALGTKNHSLSSINSAVESDDEITRGAQRKISPRTFAEMPPKRNRTRSSIRNLFSKLTRSLSQEQNPAIYKTGNVSRSTLADHTQDKCRNVELFPPLSHFVDWRLEQLTKWLEKAGFAQYIPEVTKNVRSGRHLLNMSCIEFETWYFNIVNFHHPQVLGMKNALLRKRLNVLLRRIEDDIDDHGNVWDIQQTQKWLEDIGLPQYKEIFFENMIDGVMILALTAADLAESIVSSYPRPDAAVRWTHAATCEWLRMIDLAEFTPHLLCAGTPGALMVCEPTFTAETLAEILQIPPHKTLLRRHLTTHFNQLLGQRIVAEKRDFLASGILPLLLPGMRIKVGDFTAELK
ncbi:unnamed protein product [Angiostrongylus costaricensis]|uniref:SAM domain-containing protein n=1 Tax=Angiostrongylus costaricensis TaxID=334426 RepID=A0A158PIK4_ANGCS|nr:unnamed protein product [Angiostrongylus costaricensis]